MPTAADRPFIATRNACKLCAPLGACLAIRGIEGAVPFLHGSQGCATYIRRYMISHFREPLDVASSNFGEMTAIFGGRENLRTGLANVVRQYQPRLVGIATTCLAETIGDDVPLYLHEIEAGHAANGSSNGHAAPLPEFVHISTPSYRGTHAEGYWAAIRALLEKLAGKHSEQGAPRTAEEADDRLLLMPGIVSPADLRYLKEICRDFSLALTLLPDYSETLDGPAWTDYQRIPKGGTPVEAIRRAHRVAAAIEFSTTLSPEQTPAALLTARFGVERATLPLPIGVRLSDGFFERLEHYSGRATPAEHAAERGRLIDCYVDAHKYIFGKRAVIYGEQDLVVSLAAFLSEIGITPVLCGSGAETGRLREKLREVVPELPSETAVREGADFAELQEQAAALEPDLVVGNSKGYKLARAMKIPLVRVGFPIHDRIDGPRLLMLGYRGAQQLFDRIVNAVIESAQEDSDIGYSYM
ncbi:MAG: nitrogenase component 1 [Planctomycetota bacterium]